MKRFASLGASLVLCAVLLSPQPAAQASNACGIAPGNYFAAAGNPPSVSTFGIRAKIEYRTLNLCDSAAGSNGGTSAWAMLTADPVSTAGKKGYAQVGYFRNGVNSGYRDGTWNFTQYSSLCYEQGTCQPGQAQWATAYWGQPDQALHIYTVARASDEFIHMRIDGTYLTRMAHKVGGVWKPEWESNYAAETHQQGDDVPGTTANTTSFYFLQRQLTDGTWQYYANWSDLAPFATISRHHAEEFNPATGLGFQTWTDPL